MEKESHKIRSIRLSEEVWIKLKQVKRHSWNSTIKKLLEGK